MGAYRVLAAPLLAFVVIGAGFLLMLWFGQVSLVVPTRGPPAWYPGKQYVNLVVRNSSGFEIDVQFWSEFGIASPSRGRFKNHDGSETAGNIPEVIPESTIVFWTVEGDAKEYRQEISLRGLPKDTGGEVIAFEFHPNSIWTVSYAGKREGGTERIRVNTEGGGMGKYQSRVP
jgi:hypothetical protein